MASPAEIRKDMHELQNLRSMASRPDVQKWLGEKINECELRMSQLKKKETQANGDGTPVIADRAVPATATAASAPLPTVKVTNYGWDESDKYVKLYITMPGVQSVSAEHISVKFTDSDVEMTATNVGQKNYTLVIKGLCGQIVPSASLFKQKTDTLLLMMKKKSTDSWKHLTKAEKLSKEKSTPKFDEKSDPQESLMGMMKQMYDDGDDEMKRSIRKAWHESQSKKGGAPPGLDDL